MRHTVCCSELGSIVFVQSSVANCCESQLLWAKKGESSRDLKKFGDCLKSEKIYSCNLFCVHQFRLFDNFQLLFILGFRRPSSNRVQCGSSSTRLVQKSVNFKKKPCGCYPIHSMDSHTGSYSLEPSQLPSHALRSFPGNRVIRLILRPSFPDDAH